MTARVASFSLRCAVSSSPLSRRSASAAALASGFTLVELMVALALAAMISVSIMFISSQARLAYDETAKKVEVYGKYRYVFRQLEDDLKNWISTSDLEFFIDGKGKTSARNQHWDPQEEVPDRRDEFGPGVVDGGVHNEYDEYPSIEQRHYVSREPMQTEDKVHDSYRVYFRTLVYLDGSLREANVEYLLLDTSKMDRADSAAAATGLPMPTRVSPENVADVALFKVVRYFNVTPKLMERPSDTPIVRKVIEVCSSVTDFKIEYFVEGGNKIEPGFRTPEDEYKKPSERAIRPTPLQSASGGPIGGYRKVFGYGSTKLEQPWPRATAYPGIRADDGLAGVSNPAPLRFGFQGDPNMSFGELIPGDRVFVFRPSEQAAQSAQGAVVDVGARNKFNAVRFPTADYTVKSNLDGLLEFVEDVDTSEWQGKPQSNIYYKASYSPAAVRITLRVVDDSGQNPKTLQREVWLRRRSM